MDRVRFKMELLKFFYEKKALLSNKAFYCAALTGESTYNVSINSDLTVSCNCSDLDKSGCLGDMNIKTLTEIYSDKRAAELRKFLAEGKIPILQCTLCMELKVIEKNKAKFYKENYKVPSNGIMVENNSNCNLNCLACKREQLYSIRKKRKLSLEDINKISKTLKEHKIKNLFYFKLGEPFLSKNIKEELQLIREDNPEITICISTNGLLIDSSTQREAAMYADHMLFSIDGSRTDILNKYQRNGNFDKAYSNMKELVEYRNSLKRTKPVIEWKYVLFRWNDKKEYIDEAIELAKKANVDIISFWPGAITFYRKPFRYHFAPFFKKIGKPNIYGREINFRKAEIEQ